MANYVMKTVFTHVTGYTKHQCAQAGEACQVQHIVGNPSNIDIKNMVGNNILANCTVIIHDIGTVTHIFNQTSHHSVVKQSIRDVDKDEILCGESLINDLGFLLLACTRSSLLLQILSHGILRQSWLAQWKCGYHFYYSCQFNTLNVQLDGEFRQINDMVEDVNINSMANTSIWVT